MTRLLIERADHRFDSGPDDGPVMVVDLLQELMMVGLQTCLTQEADHRLRLASIKRPITGHL